MYDDSDNHEPTDMERVAAQLQNELPYETACKWKWLDWLELVSVLRNLYPEAYHDIVRRLP